MVSLPQPARDLLEGPHLAHVVTVDPDGAPQVSCVWVGLDGDEVVFGSLGPFRKIRNLERDPRIALSVESPNVNDMGMREYLVVQGVVLLIATAFVLINVLVDLLYSVLDPRVRRAGA